MSAVILKFIRMHDQPNRIRELRLALGLSQAELAERVGCSSMQISGLERGTPKLDVEWMRRIAVHLGVMPADLLNNADNPLRLRDDEAAMIERLREADDATRRQFMRVSEALIPWRDQDGKLSA